MKLDKYGYKFVLEMGQTEASEGQDVLDLAGLVNHFETINHTSPFYGVITLCRWAFFEGIREREKGEITDERYQKLNKELIENIGTILEKKGGHFV